MGVYIPNIEKPKEAVDVEVIFRDSEGYVVGHKLYCPLIEIDDELFKKAESAYVLQQIRERRNDE